MTDRDQTAEECSLISAFTDDGYVCVDPLFDTTQMESLNREIERFISDIVPGMPETMVYYEDKSDKTSLKQIQKMFEHDAFFEYINGFYNPRRKHSALGWESPLAFEAQAA